jgi:signal transduction histidine kinase/HAMP domain-containing protein
MTSKLKTKISIGVVFLFALLLFEGGAGLYYLNKTIAEQRNILKENYESIEYARNMLSALDSISDFKAFEINLSKQEKNITEPGEKTATDLLRTHFNKFQQEPSSEQHITEIRDDINQIMQMNLAAIIRKNKLVDDNAENARIVITLLLTVSTLIAFTFVSSFPGYIANPIHKLTEAIKGISNKQYEQRIHLERNDEFGEMAIAFNQMAEELNKYEHSNLAKILFEKQRAETVINSLKDASIGIGTNNSILFANLQALQLLNLKEIDIIGKDKEIIANQNDLFKFLLADAANQPFKIVVDGKEQFFHKETTEIQNEEGKIGTLIVLKNITPFKELDVAKTNFIATVSHELKTPLASSDFSLKLLEDERIGTLNPEQKELVQHIKNDNHRLLKILSELLDFSQVESGKIQLHINPINPIIPIQRAIESVEAAANEKKIQININSVINGIQVKADAEKTAWVLINFLTNAIKHSHENSTISIDLQNVGGSVEFSVKDTGIGIESAYLTKIFDRFYKVPGSKKTGSGLGLSISKEFIEAMGGSIGVESTPNLGSRFYFSLPISI